MGLSIADFDALAGTRQLRQIMFSGRGATLRLSCTNDHRLDGGDEGVARPA